MGQYEHVVHPFAPLFDKHSRILILGSFPSVKSREQMFYYGHPQNRFWKVLTVVMCGQAGEVPVTIEEKKAFLLSHQIALWDVIDSCDIIGSSDSSIKNVQPTDIPALLEKTKIERIFCNGKLSGRMYEKYQKEATGIDAVVLPSTSPANAVFSLEKLLEEWKVVLD